MSAVIQILRAYDYFYFSLLAMFISFLPVYLSAQGFSATQIGAVIGTGAFIGILSQPLWGFISDKGKTIKKVLILMLAISVVVGTLLFRSSGFFTLYLLAGLMYFFYLPTDPLTESLNYQLAQKEKVSFGAVRTFGAIGYATTSLMAGYIASAFGITILGWMYLAFGLLTVLLAWRLPDVPTVSKPVAFSSLAAFFKHSRAVRFFIVVLLMALPHRMNDIFLGVYIQSIGGTTGQVGLAWFISAASEALFFAWSARFLRSGRELNLIIIAAGLYALRYIATALAPGPEWVAFLQLLQGVTFVIFYTAAIQYLYGIIPEEWKSTGQMVLAVLFFGVSGIVGSFVGGWIFDTFGGASLYNVMAVLSVIGLIAGGVMFRKKGVEAGQI
ncbi:MFS transporter [Brevibacillus dissolubilis]|uniref:MFS transporter n=1 Tax=Brevibacillus dissolubilis TaxID=1844116 RepID=UPI0011163502|nr:MFS transporter [Brevibacillus dissolubilis]